MPVPISDRFINEKVLYKTIKYILILERLPAVFIAGCLLLFSACSSGVKMQNNQNDMEEYQKGSYGYDLEFLKKHGSPIELVQGVSRVLLSARYQGRVMTSSASGVEGKSYGWLNYKLIESGEVLEQFNPVGGEDRFWLGPEGGQFSIFFSEGEPFEFKYWGTPAPIDTQAFEVKRITESEAEFAKSMKITNYSNFTFNLDVNRKVRLLKPDEIEEQLQTDIPSSLGVVAYQTLNRVQNTGEESWMKETGLLSIWLLGMFNPSPSVTIIIPYDKNAKTDYIVKDDYFGKIPDDRLIVEEGIIYFRGDGKQRGKLGVPPGRALPVIGSYDAENKVLTIVKTDIPENEKNYVNSAWEIQDNPYKGDVINSYNDGPREDGGQLGPFYELETSSPALALKPGEEAVHSQSTFHVEGSEEYLDILCQKIFGITLDKVKTVF